MRTVIVFVTGLAIGTVMSPLLAQGDRIPGVNNMNHVAIAYENFDEAFDFYTKKMGFKEGFTVRNAQGQPALSYVQASRDTFIEIQPANANRKAGLNHYGLHVPFLLAAGGFVLTALLDRLILKVPSAGHMEEGDKSPHPASLKEPAHAN